MSSEEQTLGEQAVQAVVSAKGLSFLDFFEGPFSIGYEDAENVWGPGDFHRDLCGRIDENALTCTIAPRGSLKSSVFRSYVAYLVWLLPELDRNVEVLYMSYKQDLAGYHCGKIRDYIDGNRLFRERGIVPLTDARTVPRYISRRTGRVLTCMPVGVMAFKRGIHSDVVLCDDLLTDPRKRLDVAQIVKVTEIFLREVLKIPKIGRGTLHVAGTPQDSMDLLFSMRGMGDCNWKLYPAIDEKGGLLWPEVLTAKRLVTDLKRMGRNAFLSEMLCKPARSALAFLDRELLLLGQRTWELAKKGDVFGGFDIGKKRHPSHLALFRYAKGGHLQEVESKWMDGWDYHKQREYLRTKCAEFEVRVLAYDNTRGEFEGFAERKELPRCMEPVVLSSVTRGKIAADLDVEVTNGRLHLLDEKDDAGYDRQLEQMMAVDGSLDSMETAMGHGDSFWSVALAVLASKAAGRPRGFVSRYLREA